MLKIVFIFTPMENGIMLIVKNTEVTFVLDPNNVRQPGIEREKQGRNIFKILKAI